MRRRLALVQVSSAFGESTYLPYAVGLLWAYAKESLEVRNTWAPPTFVYRKEPISKALTKLQPAPDLLVFSCYVWNWRWNRALAKAVREVSPCTTIVYGGVHVPDHPDELWWEAHPEADYLIHGEGEQPFRKFLEEFGSGRRDFGKVPGLSSREFSNKREFAPLEDLRSPYLDGVFEPILREAPHWQILQETNRGCPFACTFCVDEHTEIATIRGSVAVRDLLPDDKVFGWDTHNHLTSVNSFGLVVSNGEKPVLEVRAGDYCVRATPEHLFYTRDGWKKAGSLVPGQDEVLCQMRGLSGGEASQTAVLLQQLLDDFRRKEGENPTGSRGRQVREVEESSFRENETKQPHETEGSQGEAGEHPAREDQERRGRALDEHAGGEEGHRGHCEEATVQLRQPHEGCQDRSPHGPDEESPGGLREGSGLYAGEEPDAGLRREGESHRGACRPRSEEEVRRGDAAEAQPLRDTSGGLSRRAGTPLPLHGQLQLLGGALQVRVVQEPRLHPHDGRDEESNSRPRNLLAQRQTEREDGTGGLRGRGLGLLHHLGEVRSRRRPCEEDTKVSWIKVSHIRPAGVSRVYDIVGAYPHPNFFADGILVHNCEWGASALNKIRQFPLDRVLEEIDWMGRHQSEYVEGCDANFGILARDEQIAEALVKTKEKYGYPQKFRSAFAKYTNQTIADRIFRIAKMLNRSGQLKSVTLALQSLHEPTLEAIKRKNISMGDFAKLQQRYKANNIPTYTETILGLPDETYQTFCAGIDTVLDSGQEEGISIYTCVLLPNSEMSEPAYIAKYGIQSVTMRAMLLHGTPTPDTPDEIQETVIATKDMPFADWVKAYMLSWAVQVLHSCGLTRWWAQQERPYRSYTRFYEHLIKLAVGRPRSVLGRVYSHTLGLLVGAIDGGSWDNVLPEFGANSWPPDTGGFLLIARELDTFYAEMELHLGMPSRQREEGPPPVPAGREVEYARQVWYGRKGSFLEGLRKVVGES